MQLTSKRYNGAYLGASLAISTPLLIIFMGGINGNNLFSLGSALFLFCLWFVAPFLLLKMKCAFIASFVLINLLWWPLLVQTLSRITFVIVNHGLDRADGEGSPLAFLIGFAFELIIFLPLTVAMMAGISAIRKSWRASKEDGLS